MAALLAPLISNEQAALARRKSGVVLHSAEGGKEAQGRSAALSQREMNRPPFPYSSSVGRAEKTGEGYTTSNAFAPEGRAALLRRL